MPNDAVIHLIDDDEHVRRAVAFLLGTAGLAVRVHESAEKFLGELENLQPGCIVSDVRMPGLDGVGLQRRLGERGVDMPTIIMTGHADVALAVAAMKAGAVDFIEKPFDDEVSAGRGGGSLVALPPSRLRLWRCRGDPEKAAQPVQPGKGGSCRPAEGPPQQDHCL